MPTTEETQALVPVLPCKVRSPTGSASTHEEFCVPLKVETLVTGSNGKKGPFRGERKKENGRIWPKKNKSPIHLEACCEGEEEARRADSEAAPASRTRHWPRS